MTSLKVKTQNHPSYIIERWPLGWLVCSPAERPGGVPFEGMSEPMALYPKDAVIDAGVARHFRYNRHAVIAIGTPEDMDNWRKQIEAGNDWMNPESQWFNGCDCGMSSLAMFSALATDRQLANRASDECGKDKPTPRDADDLGRCIRLLDKIPEFKERLSEVAKLSPEWDRIIQNWPELVASTPNQQSEMLRKFNTT